jgi:hypothetical protein
MAFAYPLSLPSSPDPVSFKIVPERAIGVTESDFSFEQQIFDWEGRRWHWMAEYPPLLRDDAEEWMAFFLQSEGPSGTFLLGPSMAEARRGRWGSSVLVKGGSQTGNALIVDGLTANDPLAVKKGDWFQLGTGLTARLYKCVADVAANASGEASLSFWPAILSAPADNAAVTTMLPKGLFRMLRPNDGWNRNLMFYGVGPLEAVSVI